MCSVEPLREFIRERLTAAAEEIFTQLEKTIVQYEEEIDRQRRLLDLTWRPRVSLQRAGSEPSGTGGRSRDSLQLRVFISGEEADASEEPDLVDLDPTRAQNFPGVTLEAEEQEGTSRNKERHPGREARTPKTDQNQHFCKTCSKGFSQKHYLTKHLRVHAVETPLTCPTCSQLTAHLRTHSSDRPFPCPVCGRGFCDSHDLSTHMRTHTGEKPFPCLTCGKRFSQRGNLTIHMRTHTGEKPYACHVCGKGFSERCDLSTHMRTHTGEKPFQCLTCEKSFNNKFNLIAHMRTHTGERPFQCGTCGKSFCQRGNLNVHMRTHTGEKPFLCLSCGKRFQRKGNLMAHMTTHS
uniref:C2H2-type domain-containing protein n=1 Tax=Poecilia mexicana TaxID=48701 RepID=A0A3B3YNG4_9TELE